MNTPDKHSSEAYGMRPMNNKKDEKENTDTWPPSTGASRGKGGAGRQGRHGAD